MLRPQAYDTRTVQLHQEDQSKFNTIRTTLDLYSVQPQSISNPVHVCNTPVTHTRRTAHTLSNKNWSSASLCIHEFCQNMRGASEFKTNIQRVINKSGA